MAVAENLSELRNNSRLKTRIISYLLLKKLAIIDRIALRFN